VALVAALGAAVWSGPAAPAAAAQKELAGARERAESYVRQNLAGKAPGVSVAVGRKGKLAWSAGFGYADLERKIPVTPKTQFRVGSVSKSLTAAGLMLLVEQGKLDLDAPVQKYVPDFPDKGHTITTRQLAGHLAGIRHYRGDEFLLNRPFATVREGLKIFENDPLLHAPGEKYLYSTYGWNLISAVMEGAAGENFLRYMERRVFRPLKMKSTVPDYAGKELPQRTRFYQRGPGGEFVLAPAVDNSYKWAGGGFLSTPEDLVRFGSALLEPGFLKAESLAAMFTSQKTNDGKETGYGIGWNIARDAQGHRILFHTGGSVGGTSVLLLHPETGVVVAITANLSGAPIRKEDREQIAEIFGALAGVAGESKGAQAKPAPRE
jgi:CubicO group peptidase (beta-lactamase class C family)